MAAATTLQPLGAGQPRTPKSAMQGPLEDLKAGDREDNGP